MEKYKELVSRLHDTPLSGLVMASISGMWFTVSNFMVQVSTELNNRKRIPIHQVVFARSLEQLVFLIPIILLFRLSIHVAKTDFISLIFMSLSGFLNIVFIYMALDKIPISDAIVITFTSPVFAAIFSFMILKEKVHWLDGICGVISFLGVVIVARPTFIFGNSTHARKQIMFRGDDLSRAQREIVYIVGASSAMLGSISLALYFVTTRKFATRSQNIVNLFYPSLMGTLLSPALMFGFQEELVIPDNIRSVLSVLSVGVFGSFGLGFLTLSLMLDNATNVALIRNLDLIYAYILQYFVMGIKPSVWSVGGGVIIISATTVLALRRQGMCCKTTNKEEVVGSDDE